MKRRDFLKASSLAAAATRVAIPASLTMHSLLNRAYAAPINYEAVNFTPPANLPQVINVFLYGGPSDLAGNLTNIEDIDANSQTPYPDIIVNTPGNGGVTNNALWAAAGGTAMESMLAAGDMSIYRTLMKRKEDSRSHRQSIFMGLKGSLDIDNTPGVGSRIAALFDTHRAAMLSAGHDVDSMVLPFVSFEGTTTAFAPDATRALPLTLRGITLGQDFSNPYQRGTGSGDTVQTGGAEDLLLEALVNKVVDATQQRTRFAKALDSFSLRVTMEQKIGDLSAALGAAPAYTNVNGNNQFNARIRAAVTLALANPDSVYITVGGGLGGWDDHNNGVDQYPERMRQLMEAMQNAVNHINGSSAPNKNRIVINAFGDFGRYCNLNGSSGWDHGNNQILYTFGGRDIRPDGLGKIVGTTRRVGASKQNNQDLVPTNDSYEAEPMSVASTVYSYFGVQNPQILTADPVFNIAGDPPLNETSAVPNERV
jgi:Protein of unknown function (DUF1501)